MGDRLALNSFCLVKPIYDSIAAASTTQAEGIKAMAKTAAGATARVSRWGIKGSALLVKG